MGPRAGLDGCEKSRLHRETNFSGYNRGNWSLHKIINKIKYDIKEVQKTVILGTAHIRLKVLK
jgi:hypothetical protein